MADCVFCRILAGEIPGSFVYRDELCAAFVDIQPVNPGHLLVIPTRHAAHLADLDPPTAGHLMEVAQRLAAALRTSGLRCEGVNLFLADGEAAMQEVFHVHLHVFPRFAGDGFGLRFGPDYLKLPPRDALEAAAAQIRRAIEPVGSTAPK
ncbi:MAG: HIT family protein [Gemmatimonadaceae bacterium]